MAKAYLSEFVDLLPLFEAWSAAEALTATERCSIRSAIKTQRA
jgi:hypothetical protein